jgi:hypothetical protein
MSAPYGKVEWVKWWKAKTYKDNVSTTEWLAQSNKLSLSAFAIAMFHPEKNKSLNIQNNGYCAFAVRKEIVPTGDSKNDKKRAKELLKEAVVEVKAAQKHLIEKGNWPKGTSAESHVIVK